MIFIIKILFYESLKSKNKLHIKLMISLNRIIYFLTCRKIGYIIKC